MTYLILNSVFILAVFAMYYFHRQELRFRAILFALVILLVCTVAFDSLIIAANIVSYDASKISGLFIWRAPIEDFYYAIASVFLVPTIWKITQRRGRGKTKATI